MNYLTLYDPGKTYISPAGTIMDRARVAEKFPAATAVPFVVQTDGSGTMMQGMYILAALKSQYGIPPALSNDEAVAAIQKAMDAEQEAQSATPAEPTAEERIAAALEFQNAMNS